MKPFNILTLTLSIIAGMSCMEMQNEQMNPIDGSLIKGNKTVANRMEEVFQVYPSGDLSGVTDANNLELALNLAKDDGGTVLLSDGNPKTEDVYYVSRNITIYSFKGVMKGEGKNRTKLYAGRKSNAEGFQGTESSYWMDFGYMNIFPTVLQFYYGTGDLTISDLSILIQDEQPCDVYIDEYGAEATHMTTIIEVFGGAHNTYINNVRMAGAASSSYGSRNGRNTAFGIHIMPGSSSNPYQKGDMVLEEVDIEEISYGSILFMLQDEASKIKIKKGQNF